ncbi:hypothetical protein MNAN1_002433 [Malassezia nana]|uniref:Uncharacterized protein n=1 Tax=Malassezia nana TaxID=180528 RepID=A0AAF0ERH0_9BASI|nr:hypothetical protein MNAN1_002433 [Malassezia nana]
MRAWAAALGDMDAAASFLWKPGAQGKDNLRRWKSYWHGNGANGANPPMAANSDMFRAPESKLQPGSDKLTVSPKDLHLDYNEAHTPPAKYNNINLFGDMAPLFPSQPSLGDSTSQTMPLSLSSGMETGSSTEEEDDEDEKPFQPSTNTQDASMGITMPNERLLEQWSKPLYGPPRNVSENHELQTVGDWPTVGPTFSSMSTSSESEDELLGNPGPRMQKSRGRTNPLARTNSGAMTGYGYIPSSQDSAFSTSTDTESMGDSQMSISATESEAAREDTAERSPSILNSAQAITPATDQEEETQPSLEDPSKAAVLRSSDYPQKNNMSSSDVPDNSMAPSSEPSSPEPDGDSDYEQTHHDDVVVLHELYPGRASQMRQMLCMHYAYVQSPS